MGKYDQWKRFFESLEGERVTVTLDELETLVDGDLPPSARQYAAWWHGERSYAHWQERGWEVSPNLRTGEVTFHRKRPKPEAAPEPQESAPDLEIEDGDRLILLGCVKTKAQYPAPAEELYRSPLWMKRRRYAESTGMPWAILSAEHGMIDPDTVIEPYDRYMGDQSTEYRRHWSKETADQVIQRLRRLDMDTVEVHAGAEYLENGLISRLNEEGVQVLWPLQGLAFGEQLSWYGSSDTSSQGSARVSVAENARSPVGQPGDYQEEVAEIVASLRELADRIETVFKRGSGEPVTTSRQEEIVQALRRYGDEIAGLVSAGSDPEFTPDPAANAFLVQNPFAFLLAVIADYQIPAERAWAVPWELKKRIGHLEPELMLEDPDSLYRAFDQPPKLHRFIRNVPGFFLEACEIVLEDYGGNAGRIWDDEPTASELQSRLVLFPGISQKKAAMAVEILERDLEVPIRDMQGSDLAFDVHVRRVMLRTGLAAIDDQQHMIDRARQLNPERPGALDFPMWNIGRTWCRAGIPDCPDCVLTDVCPKLVDAASGVKGA